MFFSLLGIFYMMYGEKFLHEAYIYHGVRVDHRHNFSFNYFFEYLYYLDLPHAKYLTRFIGQAAQFGLAGLTGIFFYKDLFFSMYI